MLEAYRDVTIKQENIDLRQGRKTTTAVFFPLLANNV